MKAQYKEKQAFPDNYFIAAMPERLSASELVEALRYTVPLDDKVRKMPESQRLLFCSKVYEAFYPLPFANAVYDLIYNGMVSSFATKGTVQAVMQTAIIKEAIDLKIPLSSSTFLTQASSCSILGSPGIGKSSTIARILNLFPQVIEHREYKGQKMFCKQINYLNVQCPADCSIKAMCANILIKIDMVLGTGYSQKATSRSTVTLDALAAQLSQLCITHNIGVIIVDEIQNVIQSAVKYGNNRKLINFLVQLMNDTGICVILVGTPEAGSFFDAEPHLARRTRGPRIAPLEYGPVFHRLVSALWEMQCTRVYQPLTERIEEILYEMSGGLPALLAQAISLSQSYAIETGVDCLTEDVIRNTAVIHKLRAPSKDRRDLGSSTPASKFSEVKDVDSKMDHMETQKVSKGKGRPKAWREKEDLLVLFKEEGDFVQRLEELNILERWKRC